MIDLITGLPGNGKTVFTLSWVKERAEKENRPVFYHGISELTLPWEQLDDPKNWASVPPGAIVVIDEAQKTFRNRSLGSVPPSFVTELETHRHLGIDLVLITQHPSLIDPAVRRLTGRHRHLVRMFGMEASTVHEWPSCKDNCDKSRSDSEKKKWAFDKAAYSYYKSAELHTVKRQIPGRLKLLAFCVLALIGCVWATVNMIQKKIQPAEQQIASGPAISNVLAPAGQPVAGQAEFDPLRDARNYVAMNTPRVVGLPQTAPRYDELTKPNAVPVPAMCIRRGERCQCYTQQATKMAVPFNQCVDIAYNGYFQDFDPDPSRKEQQAQQRPVQAPVATDSSAPVVLAFGGPSSSNEMAQGEPAESQNDSTPPRRAIARKAL